MDMSEELDRLYGHGVMLLESIEADEQSQRTRIAQLEQEIAEQKTRREGLLARLSGLLEEERGQ